MKKILICLVTLALVWQACETNDPFPAISEQPPAISNTPGSWTRMADFAGEHRFSFVDFSIGNKGYLGMGTGNKCDLWEFDPQSNCWTQKANFPPGSRLGAVGFTIANKAYVGTGQKVLGPGNAPVEYLADFWAYNPKNNSWQRKADFPGELRVLAVAFSVANKGYIGTGQSETEGILNDFWEYNPESDSWRKIADLPGVARQDAFAFATDSKGYVGTGSGPAGFLKDFYQYDPQQNKWLRKADFPEAVILARGFAIANIGYAGVGSTAQSSTQVENKFFEYLPDKDVWYQKASFPGIYRNGVTAFSIGDKGYLGMGYNPGFPPNQPVFFKDLWQFTP